MLKKLIENFLGQSITTYEVVGDSIFADRFTISVAELETWIDSKQSFKFLPSGKVQIK